MRSGSTLTTIWALALLAACGDAVPVDEAARKAEDERRVAAQSVDDAAVVKVREDRDAAYAREREREAASEKAQEIEDATGNLGGQAPAPTTPRP